MHLNLSYSSTSTIARVSRRCNSFSDTNHARHYSTTERFNVIIVSCYPKETLTIPINKTENANAIAELTCIVLLGCGDEQNYMPGWVLGTSSLRLVSVSVALWKYITRLNASHRHHLNDFPVAIQDPRLRIPLKLFSSRRYFHYFSRISFAFRKTLQYHTSQSATANCWI